VSIGGCGIAPVNFIQFCDKYFASQRSLGWEPRGRNEFTAFPSAPSPIDSDDQHKITFTDNEAVSRGEVS
jgi:hypothetical protein